MDELYKEYNSLLESQSFKEEDFDYSLQQKHIEQLASSAYLRSSAVSVFDSFLKYHVYESDYHRELFINFTYSLYLSSADEKAPAFLIAIFLIICQSSIICIVMLFKFFFCHYP